MRTNRTERDGKRQKEVKVKTGIRGRLQRKRRKKKNRKSAKLRGLSTAANFVLKGKEQSKSVEFVGLDNKI